MPISRRSKAAADREARADRKAVEATTEADILRHMAEDDCPELTDFTGGQIVTPIRRREPV